MGLLYFAIAGTALIRAAGLSALILAFGAPQLVTAAMLIMIFVDRSHYATLKAPVIVAKILSISPLIYVILTSLDGIALPGDSAPMGLYRAYVPFVVLVIDGAILAGLARVKRR